MQRMGWRWRGLAPGLRASPGAGCREVDVDGDSGRRGDGLLGLSGADGGRGGLEELSKAIAELGDGVAQGEEAVKQDGACEVEGVAGGVEVAFQGRGLFSSERQGEGGEVEAGGLRGRIRAGLTRGVGGGRRGAEQKSAQRDGFGAERGELQGFVGELKFAGEDRML